MCISVFTDEGGEHSYLHLRMCNVVRTNWWPGFVHPYSTRDWDWCPVRIADTSLWL